MPSVLLILAQQDFQKAFLPLIGACLLLSSCSSAQDANDLPPRDAFEPIVEEQNEKTNDGSAYQYCISPSDWDENQEFSGCKSCLEERCNTAQPSQIHAYDFCMRNESCSTKVKPQALYQRCLIQSVRDSDCYSCLSSQCRLDTDDDAWDKCVGRGSCGGSEGDCDRCKAACIGEACFVTEDRTACGLPTDNKSGWFKCRGDTRTDGCDLCFIGPQGQEGTSCYIPAQNSNPSYWFPRWFFDGQLTMAIRDGITLWVKNGIFYEKCTGDIGNSSSSISSIGSTSCSMCDGMQCPAGYSCFVHTSREEDIGHCADSRFESPDWTNCDQIDSGSSNGEIGDGIGDNAGGPCNACDSYAWSQCDSIGEGCYAQFIEGDSVYECFSESRDDWIVCPHVDGWGSSSSGDFGGVECVAQGDGNPNRYCHSCLIDLCTDYGSMEAWEFCIADRSCD